MTKLLMMNKDNLPDIVYCHNDLVAIGAIDAASIHGLRIPEDIVFVETDNISLSQFTNPNLTTLNPKKCDS